MSRLVRGARALVLLASLPVLAVAGCGDEEWCNDVSGEWDLVTDLGDEFPNFNYQGTVQQEGCKISLDYAGTRESPGPGTMTYGKVDEDVVTFPISWVSGPSSDRQVHEAICKAKHVGANTFNSAAEGLGCVEGGETDPVAMTLNVNCLGLVDPGGLGDWDKVPPSEDKVCFFDDFFVDKFKVSQTACVLNLVPQGDGYAATAGRSMIDGGQYSIRLDWPTLEDSELPAGVQSFVEIQNAVPWTGEIQDDWKEMSDIPAKNILSFVVVYRPEGSNFDERCSINYSAPALQ